MKPGERKPAGGVPALWSVRVTDAVVLVFASWTVCCHFVVKTGGTILTLLATAAAVAIAAYVLLRLYPNLLGRPAAPPRTPDADRGPLERRPWILRGFGVLAALVGVGLFLKTGNALLLWWWGAVLLGVAGGLILLLERPRNAPCPPSRRHERVLWVLAAVCVLVTLIGNRPDYDDSLYVNFAVGAVENPDLPLLRYDTMHGIPDLPIYLPVYRLHSWELWNAALSILTGLPAIVCFHLISAALVAALLPLAHARLFRLLVPRLWPMAVTVLVIVLLAVGETHRWYGNFAFVRIWQGKGLALFVFLPLIYAMALEFLRAPTRRGWLLLAAGQVAAIGATSTSIWLGPVAAWSALGCGFAVKRRGFVNFALGLLASVYPLGVGWLLKSRAKVLLRPSQAAVDPNNGYGELLHQHLGVVLGTSVLQTVVLIVVLSAWALAPPRGLARRFAVGVPLAVWFVLLNPYLARWIVYNVSGIAYWRCFWALPVPILVTLAIVSPLHLKRPGLLSPKMAYAVTLGLVLGFVFLLPSYGGLSSENRVSLGWPGLKVRKDTYRIAKVLQRSVPGGSFVVAPDHVGLWLPTFQDQPYPLRVRHYLDMLYTRSLIGEQSYQARELLTRYAAGEAREGEGPDLFTAALKRFPVAAVCLKRSETTEALAPALSKAGFHIQQSTKKYLVWVRRRIPLKRTTIPQDGLKETMSQDGLRETRPEDGLDETTPEGGLEEKISEAGFEEGDLSAWSGGGS